ncbi:hypothetical protein [Rhizobium leguminosarum]|uniref:hypothetical protein n=1 Tax=Rhizobium leguminosarum TaxID=384 RepID=UPI001C954047|nr:hypothetical protein [Rhizobium leguminosarum]MBY5422285.1 hypothetical protein [Rhizobium leguminosarum]
MDKEGFDMLFNERVAGSLARLGFVSKGKTLYCETKHFTIALVRLGGRMSSSGAISHILCFRHSFLRDRTEQIPSKFLTEVFDYPYKFKPLEDADKELVYRPQPNGEPAVDPPNVFGSEWASPDKPNLSPEELIASEEKRFTKRWDGLKIEFDGDNIEHPNFPAAYRGASYPLGANSRGGQLKLSGHTIGVPNELHLDQPPKAIVRDIVLANGQSISSGDGSTYIGAWQTYGLFTVGTCVFEDLWPGEAFARLSGADSNAPVA